MTVVMHKSVQFEEPIHMRNVVGAQKPVIVEKSTSATEHLNHMNGISYDPENPLTQLELMLYSSFLGQQTFYNPATDKDVEFKNSIHSATNIQNELQKFLIFPDYGLKSRQRLFYETANKALSYNFEETLKLAKKARREFLMRKSPCELIAIAADHPDRRKFNKKKPSFFRDIVADVCMIPNDMISILDSWKSLKGSKSQFPSFLDRATKKEGTVVSSA